ncbi:hypothetical protein FHS90_003365 [Rufibacter quisquiliarum]|uniref:Uncharacterized protein n=1 Tax=Rufibacter quisquiliarum TaxID=1549639 RepID=A0A839GT31_9BACT|nr:hypothetical protein [Rufibacter quisquiliarum]
MLEHESSVFDLFFRKQVKNRAPPLCSLKENLVQLYPFVNLFRPEKESIGY